MTAPLHLVAHVAGCGVLFDAARIDSVVDLGEIVPAPGAAPAVLGLAAMRSRVATVIDTARLLRATTDRDGTPGRAVVTLVDGHLYALMVDTLQDVARCDITPAPATLTADGGLPFVTGLSEAEGEMLLAIDLDALVAAATTPA